MVLRSHLGQVLRQGSKPEGPRRSQSGSVAQRREPGAHQRATPLLFGNMLAFDGETLNQAIAEVSQQTAWQFELADPSLGEERVGGYVHADAEAFIELMSSSLNLEARHDGDRRVILARRS